MNLQSQVNVMARNSTLKFPRRLLNEDLILNVNSSHQTSTTTSAPYFIFTFINFSFNNIWHKLRVIAAGHGK
jgi:hypothetical protein